MTEAELRAEAKRLISLSARERTEEAVYQVLRGIQDSEESAEELATVDREFLKVLTEA